MFFYVFSYFSRTFYVVCLIVLLPEVPGALVPWIWWIAAVYIL